MDSRQDGLQFEFFYGLWDDAQVFTAAAVPSTRSKYRSFQTECISVPKCPGVVCSFVALFTNSAASNAPKQVPNFRSRSLNVGNPVAAIPQLIDTGLLPPPEHLRPLEQARFAVQFCEAASVPVAMAGGIGGDALRAASNRAGIATSRVRPPAMMNADVR